MNKSSEPIKIFLEKELIKIQQVLDLDYLWIGNEPVAKVLPLVHELSQRMAFEISSYIVKQSPQRVEISEFTLVVRVPNTLRDWLKQEFIPAWFMERWPWLRPELREVRQTVRASTDVTVLYPKLKMAFPDEKQIVFRAEAIKWEERERDE